MTQKVEYGPDDGMVMHGSSLMGTYLTRYDTLVEYFFWLKKMTQKTAKTPPIQQDRSPVLRRTT